MVKLYSGGEMEFGLRPTATAIGVPFSRRRV
jgi:hypothetical protein